MKRTLPSWYFFRLVSISLLLLAFQHGWSQTIASTESPPYLPPYQNYSKDLSSVLSELEARFNTKFNYDRETVYHKKISQKQLLTIEHNDNLENTLYKLLSPLGLNFKKFEDASYAIYPQSPAKNVRKIQVAPSGGSTWYKGREKERMKMPTPAMDRHAFSQYIHLLEQTITGKVTDLSTGEALPGVNILAKGTSTGTVTDVEGNYRLTVADEVNTLVFSSIGYETMEETISGRNVININLSPDIQSLSEVIVVGYGTQNKSDLTGSVVRANIESFRESPNVNIAQSLQGTVPGLNIGQVDAAGENPSISVRGRSTINGNQNVLIVVDGIIYTGSLNDLNPNDIESIDVLKDPSSKAIYGAQAANGVILVTTKDGKSSSKPIFNYTGSFTTQTPSNALTLMNRDEFVQKSFDADWEISYEAPEYTQLKPNWTYLDVVGDPELRTGFENGYDYDWWDAATDPGYINAHNLSVRGNSGEVSYYLSGGYTKQKGFIINDEFERITTRINIESDLLEWFTIGAQTFGSFSDYSGTSPQLGSLARMAPVIRPTDENGEYILNPNGANIPNPFLEAAADDFDKRNSLFGNFYANIDFPFLEGLNYRLNFGNNYSWDRHYNSNRFDNGASGGAYKENISQYDWTLDHIISYKHTFAEKHQLDLTLVAGQRERNYERTNAIGINYNNLRLSYNDLSLATIQNIESEAWDESYLYQMGRINYEFDYKYLITATVRRDGFSGFARNEKTALFPSLGVGWIMSEESFLDKPWLNNLKLRGSYGSNGNLVDRYSSLAILQTYAAYVFGDGGTTVFGQQVQNLANPNLTWETTTGFNFGLDFSVLSNRFTGSIDYYRSTTNDLIFDVAIPEITGFDQITSNVGKVANRGIEVVLNADVLRKNDFNWNVNVNFASNRNEIISLLGLDANGDGQEDDLQASNLFIGESINSIFDYESGGIIQLGEEAPDGFFVGTHRIVDQNNDDFIDPNDRVIIGREEPAYRFSILNEFSYKNFTLRFFLNSIQGGKNSYLGRNMLDGFGIGDNVRRNNMWNGYDYWTPSNPDARYRRLDQQPAFDYIYYGDRSFVRLQDITLAYRLRPSVLENIGIQNLKVFVSGKNLATWTKWQGWDPEVDRGADETQSSGSFRANGRPVLRGFSIGLDMSF
uniref:TonB-dependent receptor n=1 Tax=Roseihalotalea indica TaxID=2867963 RepID=A0AA49GRJ2_9BACT|nr:TonB-dependent receptor [Tunicatimonas sp. TK19036]